jgi:outer membrane protein OmpA-like peptidoglycan-associated protein
MTFSRKAVFAAASLLAAIAVTSVPVKADDQHPPGKDEKNRKQQGGEHHDKQQRPPGPGPQGHKERPNNQGGPNNPAFVKKPPPNVPKKQFGNGGPGGNPNAFVKPKPPTPPKPPIVNNTIKVQPPPQQGGKPQNFENKFGNGNNQNKQNFQKQFGNQGKDHGPGNKPVVVNPAPLNRPATTNINPGPLNKPAATNNAFVPRVMPPKPLSAADAKKRFENMRGARKEVKIDGGKGVVIEEPGKRRIFKENNRLVIQHDENERLKRVDPQARFVKGKGGTNIAVINRPGGVKVYSETDSNGQLVRRYRRGPDGRDTVIIDNRRRRGGGRNLAAGIGIGIGIVAGAAILDSILDVPEPRIGIPRERYIVDYDTASDDDVYEALSAPPVEEFSDRYTLDEIRSTVALRDRMRRIDLNDITFEFGSWDVDPSQYGKLERIARAMQRVIDRNPNEVFMIEGYTDAVGSPEDNLSLSDRRAESVAEVLTDQFQIPFENLTTQGYGEQYLKVPTDGPERLNRRVAVRRITPLLANGSGPPPPPGAGQPPADDQSGGPDDGGPDSGGPDDGGPDQGPDQGPPPPGGGGPQD